MNAISGISATVAKSNSIAAAIAAAIKKREMTTREVARNVLKAAKGTCGVSVNLMGLSRAADETGGAANLVLSSAAGLAEEADTLCSETERCSRASQPLTQISGSTRRQMLLTI